MSNPAVPTRLADDFPVADMAQWRSLIDKALKGSDFERRLVSRTADGLRIEPLYTERPAVTAATAVNRNGFGWDIRQRHVHEDARAANAAILEDLAGGATSIEVQLAAYRQIGLASGRAALSAALQNVLFDVCPVVLKGGDATPEAASELMAVWNDSGVEPSRCQGAFNYDPLGNLAETGALSRTMAEAIDAADGLIKLTLPLPHVTALRADGHVWHAAGASEAQELAAVLATALAYVRSAGRKGISPQEAWPKIAVNLAVDADQLMGLAKLRAARILLARVADACGAGSTAGSITITAETSRTMMTSRDPWVNMLRTTMACATAAWGGADSITVLPYTCSLGQPDAFARRMARNTSIVLMEESGLGRVADPAAGSFAIEQLTADLAKAAYGIFQKIESAGGIATVIADGSLKADVEKMAQAKAAAVATGKIALTGTSAFPRLGDDGVKAAPWARSSEAAPPAKGATCVPLSPYRPSEQFEKLRDAADAYREKTGRSPQVFLACLGPLAAHAARATWIGNFLAAGGIATLQSPPLHQSADAGAAFATSGASMACICGTDDAYAELGDATASALVTAGAREVAIAGRPRELEASLKAAGVGRFIYAGCDMVATLASLQRALGVEGGGS